MPKTVQIRDQLAAPHVIGVEVLGVIRRDFLFGLLDATAASRVVGELRDWPGRRFGHRSLLSRAWELRYNVRGWDAMCAALAALLSAALITTDAGLARAIGPRCPIELV
jgi:predicted nucleic acid-binding protein